MNLRHAAALALVGWYLMVPSFSEERLECWEAAAQGDAAAKARCGNEPLAQWKQIGAYDSAAACDDARQKYFQSEADDLVNAGKAAGETPNAKEEMAVVKEANDAQCFASDDPRLKEK